MKGEVGEGDKSIGQRRQRGIGRSGARGGGGLGGEGDGCGKDVEGGGG